MTPLATGKKTASLAAIMSISLAGLAAITAFEGQRTDAYPDGAGIQTICTGHTKGVFHGQHATPGQCRQFLTEDTHAAAAALARCITEPITQPQYDALASLAFNIGGPALCRSTLADLINAGRCRDAADQFPRWNRINGRPSPGLTARRRAERAAFVADCAA